ncbi:MAG: flagellar motor switch protein FliM [candidate division KSB1 bacterium]|nr:flagellar motor switch protein FliM [candidate division KSB1 bacterium]
MAEILSQSEIDALLSDIEAGDELAVLETTSSKKKQVSVYDFRHPKIVSKEHLRILQMIHERFAKLVESYLTTRLRALVDAKLIAVDQVTYSEFMLSMSDPSCIYIMKLENLNGDAILEITLPLVFYIIDRLFGGEGNSIDKMREMTLIEQKVIEKVAAQFSDALNTAWKQVIPLDSSIEAYQSRPSFIQIAALEEMVISISLEINVQETTGFLNLCFPFQVLEEVLPQMTSQQMVRSRIKKSPDDKEVIHSRIVKANIPVHVELGRKQITLRELVQLEVGDVLKLDTRVTDDLPIFINNIERFRGKPGLYRDRVALKIVGVEKEQIEILD